MYISLCDAVRWKSQISNGVQALVHTSVCISQYPSKVFPNGSISYLDLLKKKLTYRNPSCGTAIQQIRTIFRSSNNQRGHRKLFFDSNRVRDEVLKSGRLFAFGRRVQAVQVNLNRDVRRCYQCKTYGHIAKSANNACSNEEVCSYCAGPHSTKVCAQSGQPKCANCKKSHRSGDPLCHHQIRAVGRYRAALEQ